MFGLVLDKLDGWFGRPFLLSAYFPTLLFALTNAALVYGCFPSTRPTLLSLLQDTTVGKTFDIAAFLAVVAVLAYAISPLVQIMINALEGRYIPDRLASLLVISESLRQERAFDEQQEFLQRRPVESEAKRLRRLLGEARDAGARHGAIRNLGAIERVGKHMTRLHRLFLMRQEIPAGDIAACVAELDEALRTNCAERGRLGMAEAASGYVPVSEQEFDAATRLHEYSHWFTTVALPYSAAIVEARQELSPADPYDRYGLPTLLPTRLGNAAAELKRYCKRRYEIDYDSFWPLFQIAIKEPNIRDAIVGSKTQLDFAVLLFTLALATGLGWTLLLGVWAGDDVLAFLGIFAGSAVAVWYALQAVHWTHASYASVVRAAIDASRFDVLAALRIAPPASLAEEKPIWRMVARLQAAGQVDDIAWTHPSR